MFRNLVTIHPKLMFATACALRYRAQLLTTDDQELKRLGMAGMAHANKKFDSFYVSQFKHHLHALGLDSMQH